MMQSQSPDTAQKTNEKTLRDIVISLFAGLFTGGLFGAPLSLGSYLLLDKIGIKGANRWWLWAAAGVVGVPFSWALTFAITSHFTHNASMFSSSTVAQSEKTPLLKVGEFQTDSFQYTNLCIAPYTIKNSFAQKQASVAGKLYEITADVTNTGKESKSPQLMAIEVSDGKGRIFKEADFAMRFGDIEEGRDSTDYILPGQTSKNVRLSLIDAPLDATNFTLKINGGLFSAKDCQTHSAAVDKLK